MLANFRKLASPECVKHVFKLPSRLLKNQGKDVDML
jgi:hypothetical protein